MSTPPLFERLRRARAFQVLVVYLGVSWVVLQLVDTLMGLLSLPTWVGPVAVVLLLIGLVVIMATAWVQSLPRTTQLEEAGEVPTDWEVAPADIVESLRRGELPHLTWGRALTGGVMAMCLLFGAAGLYVVVKGPLRVIGPVEVGAADASRAIAVLPFHVTGPSLDLYREGMVDLVSANLDGLSGYRAIDARTLLARWNRAFGDGDDAELRDALGVAAGTGARYAVVGSGVELGPRIRFTADIYDLDSGDKVGSGEAEGAPDEVLGLVDALTVDVMRTLLDASGQISDARAFRLASLLTESVPALRAYLEGDAAFRRSRFAEARERLERAVEEDSTFALAHWRLGEAIGWTVGIQDRESQRQKALAARFGERLPPRERTLLRVTSAIAVGKGNDVLEELDAYIERFPDDPDGWYSLGEIGVHGGGAVGLTDDRVEEALLRAPALDPTFGPYYQHALQWVSARGSAVVFDSLFTDWLATGPNEGQVRTMRLRRDLLLGEGEAAQAVVDTLPQLPTGQIDALDQLFRSIADERLARWEPVGKEMAARGTLGRGGMRDYYVEAGRLSDVEAILAADSTPQGVQYRADYALARSDYASTRTDPLGGGSRDELAGHLSALRAASTRLGPDPAQAMSRAALAARVGDRGAFDEARADVLAWLPRALAGAPFDPAEAGAFLSTMLDAVWLEGQGRYQEALDGLRNGSPSPFPNGGSAMMEADLALRLGRWAEAVRIFEGSSRTFPGRSAALVRLGRAYAELGDRERSVQAYGRLLARLSSADEGHPWVAEAREALAVGTN